LTAEPNPILEEIDQIERNQPLRTSKGPSEAELEDDQYRQDYYDTCAKQLSRACIELYGEIAASREKLPNHYAEETIERLRRTCAAIRDVFATLAKGRRHELGPFIIANSYLHADIRAVYQSALSAVNYFDMVRDKPHTYKLGNAEDKLQSILIALDDVRRDTA
jgi:hypothetical protein